MFKPRGPPRGLEVRANEPLQTFASTAGELKSMRCVFRCSSLACVMVISLSISHVLLTIAHRAVFRMSYEVSLLRFSMLAHAASPILSQGRHLASRQLSNYSMYKVQSLHLVSRISRSKHVAQNKNARQRGRVRARTIKCCLRLECF